MLRYIIYGLVIYWMIKLLKNVIKTTKPDVEIKGKSKAKPLDLSKEDVEDVDFKETKE